MVSAADVAVAGLLMVIVVPFTMDVIVDPAGMPTKPSDMGWPTDRVAVLGTVTVVEPLVVDPVRTVAGPTVRASLEEEPVAGALRVIVEPGPVAAIVVAAGMFALPVSDMAWPTNRPA